MLQEAGRRIHGTTREQPLARFALERPLLQPLPAIAPDLGVWHRVRACIATATCSSSRCLYSVPFALVGQTLWLRATDTAVAIFQDYRPGRHAPARAQRPASARTVREHLPPEARSVLRPRPRLVRCSRRSASGPPAPQLDRAAAGRSHRRAAARRAGRAAAWPSRYGSARLEAACARALAHDSPHYRTVKTILAGGFDRQPLSLPTRQRGDLRPATRASPATPHDAVRRDETAALSDLFPPAAGT